LASTENDGEVQELGEMDMDQGGGERI
jgi:hypothetical protein